MNQENNMPFYQVILNLLNPFNYLFGCGADPGYAQADQEPAPIEPVLTQAQTAIDSPVPVEPAPAPEPVPVAPAEPAPTQAPSQIIDFPAIPTKTYGNSPFDLGASSDSGLSITYTSSNESIATISGLTVTIKGAGTSTITASQVGNANYNVASDVDQILTVNTASQIIDFPAIPTKIYGVSIPFDLGASSDSKLSITYTSSNESIATISGLTVTIKGAGTSTITASQVGNANYNAASDVDQILTVNKVSQIIDFPAIPTKTYGAPFTFTLNATSNSTSGLPITYTSSKGDVAIISGSTVTLIGAGISTITARQAGNNIYNASDDMIQELNVVYERY